MERRRAAYAESITGASQWPERLSERDDPDSDEAFITEVERILSAV